LGRIRPRSIGERGTLADGRLQNRSPIMSQQCFATRQMRGRQGIELGAPDRQLNVKLKVLCSVCIGATHPGFEGRMIVGHVSATREPCAVEPLQRAKF
jgi:hypothetical protein